MNLEQSMKLVKNEIDYIKKRYDRRQVNAYMSGVLCCLVGTKQIELNDEEFEELLKYTRGLIRNTFN